MANEKLDEKAIFNVARQINSPDARREYLRHVCGADSDLLARLETLLQSYAEQSSFLETPPAPSLSPTMDLPTIEKAGTLIGPYKLLQQIGEGGMGVVYMAEQTKPIARMVALKIIKPGMDTQQVVARFEAERQALAMMDHPNIAKVLDAGTTDSQRPYFVMELVKGIPITNYCDDHHLTPKERLELFVQVLHAVQHAHQKGIIHRDIKPSNVLVAEYDQQAVPKVIDFGVAKATSQKLTDKTMFTQFGQLVGTLEYMSPEQAKLNQMDIDTRCDIYSLGVLLYELLTGDTPFDRQRLRSAAFEEMMRIIREEEPPVPSTRLSTSGMLATVSANRSTEPRKLSSFMRGELDWIVMRAMEKERSRRYDTPNAFAEDIQRFLNQEAVVARPVSNAYRMKKFAQRNWGAVIAGSVIAATLLMGFGTSTWFAIRENRARQDFEKKAVEANEQRVLAFSAKAEADNQRDIAEKAASQEANQREIAEQREVEALAAQNSEAAERAAAEKERDRVSALNVTIEKQAEQQRRMLYTSDMNLIQSAWDADNISRVQELLNAHRPQPGQLDLRGFEWHYWNRQCHLDLQTVKLPATSTLFMGNRLALPQIFSPDGSQLAGVFADEDSSTTLTIKAKRTAPNAESSTFAIDKINYVSGASLAWHPNGTHLAVSIANLDYRKIHMYDVTSSKSLFTIDVQITPDRRLNMVDVFAGQIELWISVDGSRLAAAVAQQKVGQPKMTVKFWNAGTGEELASIPLPGEFTSSVSISPDGSHIAYSSSTDFTGQGFSVKILDVASPEQIVTLPFAGSVTFRFSPDNKRLFVSGVANDSSRLTQDLGGGVFDVTSGEKIFSLPIFSQWLLSRFSPDGHWFAVCSGNRPRSVSLFSTAGDRAPVELRGHAVTLTALGFSPDSKRLYTAGSDCIMKTWDLATAIQSEHSHPDLASNLSGQLKAVSRDGLMAAAPGRALATMFPSNTRKNVVTVRDELGNVLHQSAELIGPIEWLKFSADGRRLAASAVAQEGDILTAAQLCVWDTASGAEQLTLRLSAARLSGTRGAPLGEFSPDGSKLAAILLSGPAGTQTRFIKTWNIDSRPEDWESETVQYTLGALKFSPDGERILSSSSGTVWDAGNGRMLWKARPGVSECGFSADGSRIFGKVTGNAVNSGELKLWDAGSGRELQTIRDPERILGGLNSVIVTSPNGRWLAAGQSLYSLVKVWDMSWPEREPYTLKGHSIGIQGIAFSPDSRRIATCTLPQAAGGETKLWDAETGQELLTLPGNTMNIAFSADGRMLTGELGGSYVGDLRVRRWDASRLAPHVEAEQIVEALTHPRGTDALPLASEILARIDADQDLSQDTRETAVALFKSLRREKELNETAKAIAAQPSQPRAQYERALHYLQEACATDPDNQESWSTRGLVHYRLAQSNEALAALARSKELLDRKMLALSSEDLTVKAMVQHQLAKVDEARTTLEQARSSASRNETEWQKLLAEAETLLNIGKADDHPEQWIGRRFMPRLYPRTEDENGISVNANIPYTIRKVAGDRLWFKTSQVELGTISIARTQTVAFEDASRYYTALLQTTPDSSTRDKANLYNLRALVWKESGEFDKAIKDYSEASRLNPQWAFVKNRGQAWLDKHEFEKALADFDEALRLNDNNAQLHVYRAMVRTKQGELEDSLKSFDKAIALQPKLGWIYTRRAYVWSAKGDRAQMMKDLEKGIDLSPEVSDTWSDRAWLLATSPNAEHRDGKEAVAAATEACKLSYWNDFDCLDVLAAAYAEDGEFEQAVKWQTKVVEMLPPSQRTDYESRLNLYKKREKYREPPAGATR